MTAQINQNSSETKADSALVKKQFKIKKSIEIIYWMCYIIHRIFLYDLFLSFCVCKNEIAMFFTMWLRFCIVNKENVK